MSTTGGVLAAESRAGQYQHYDIENAAAHLHGMLEGRKAASAPKRSWATSVGKSARGAGIRCDDPNAVLAVRGPKDQAEHHADEQTCHEREIERHILPLDYDIAGQPPQPDPAQIGPKQADHQNYKSDHDQSARHRSRSLRSSCGLILPTVAE